jgi:hypothetical protein
MRFVGHVHVSATVVYALMHLNVAGAERYVRQQADSASSVLNGLLRMNGRLTWAWKLLDG